MLYWGLWCPHTDVGSAHRHQWSAQTPQNKGYRFILVPATGVFWSTIWSTISLGPNLRMVIVPSEHYAPLPLNIMAYFARRATERVTEWLYGFLARWGIVQCNTSVWLPQSLYAHIVVGGGKCYDPNITAFIVRPGSIVNRPVTISANT